MSEQIANGKQLKAHLRSKSYSKSTIQSYIKNIHYFQDWLRGERIAIEEVSYQDGLAYLDYLKRKD